MLSRGNIFPSERPPSRNEQRWALLSSFVIFIAFTILLVFHDRQLARNDGFIVLVDTILALTDFLAAILFFAQFVALRSYGILCLASSFLFTALMIVAHMLTFPGALVAGGMFGAGIQTAPWLFICWHFGLPLGVIGYTALKNKDVIVSAMPRRDVAISVAAVAVLAGALTVVATQYEPYLVPIFKDSVHFNHSFWKSLRGPCVFLVALISIIFLFMKRVSLLDSWLLVVSWAWFAEVLLTTTTPNRFSMIWYSSRAFGVLASALVGFLLVFDSVVLFPRLADFGAKREWERKARRLGLEATVGSIAHELRQPFTAIAANCDAVSLFLEAPNPDWAEIRSALTDTQGAIARANGIIKSIEETFADSMLPRVAFDVGKTIHEALTLLRSELTFRAVTIELEIATPLPQIDGNKGELVQVLLNLITNAIDAMKDVSSRPRVLRICAAATEPELISMSFQDSGIGLTPALASRMFDPFFTTKSGGGGLGLALCKSIIESHSGRIYAKAGPHFGCTILIELPTEPSLRRPRLIDPSGKR